MIRVFISYSTKDINSVGEIARALDDSGIFTFFAAVDIQAGDDLLDWMNKSLEQSTHVLLFWSENAANSNWVKQEWQTAFWEVVDTKRNRIIPVRLDTYPLPLMLRRLLYLDTTNGHESVIHAVKTAVLPETDFKAIRRQRLRELSGYDEAKLAISISSQELADEKRERVQVRIYDFYYPVVAEGVFLAVLRSTGVRSLVPMERKGIHGSDMRLTGHLEGILESYEYMESVLVKHGYRFFRQ